MATKIRGMTIELSVDISKFDKAMTEASKKTYRLQNRMADLNNLLKLKPNDEGLYAQSFKTLSDQIEVSKEKLKSLNDVYKVACKDFADGKIGQDVIFALEREIKATETDIRKFDKALSNLKLKESDFANLSAKIKRINEDLKRTRGGLDEVNKALKLDPKNVDLLKAKHELLNDAILQTKHKLELVQVAQREAEKEFEKGSIGRDEYAKLSAEVVNTKKELKELTKEANLGYQKFKQMSESFKSIGDKIGNFGSNMTRKVTLPIASVFGLATREAMELEDAMIGVQKTNNMSNKELSQMKDTFLEMNKTTPVTASELANIGEIAGQLGIKKENIAQFAKTISDLTIATNLTKEQGSMDLARFMAICQSSQDSVGNLGSTIVDLGNKYATNEDMILEMSLRLAAQGKIAGLTDAQIMGVATALSTLGLKAEQGGSSMSRVMMKINTAVLTTEERMGLLSKSLEGTGYSIDDVRSAIQKGGAIGKENLEAIGNAIGMTGDDLKELCSKADKGKEKLQVLGEVSGLGAEGFAKAWRKDPMSAISAFVDGLGKMKDNGKDLFPVLEELGMKNIREIDTLQRLAGAQGTLSKATGTATEAYKDNVALKKEVDLFNQSTSNQIKELKNNLVAFADKVGNVFIPHIKDAVKWLGGMVDKLGQMDAKDLETVLKVMLAFAAVGPIATSIGGFFKILSGIFGIAGALSGKLAILKGGFALASGGASGFIGALAGLNPIVATIIGAGVLGGLIFSLKNVFDYMGQASVKSDLFGDDVSRGTAKAVQGFLDLDRDASNALTSLKVSGEIVSGETVESIAGKFGEIGSLINEKVEERKEEALGSLRSMYEDMGVINDQDTIDTLAKVEQRYNDIQTKTDEGNARIKEILTTASNEKRALTDEERREIVKIQGQMKDDGIRILSDSEQEYGIIRQRMKDQAGKLSTEQASKLVSDSIKIRDETIKNAEEEYDKRIRTAQELKDDGSRESTELADKIIADAKKTRDETIKKANEQHENIVREAKKQAREHVDEVNWETGKILSNWEILKRDSIKHFENMGTGIKNKLAKIGNHISLKFENFKRILGEVFEDIGGFFDGIGKGAGDAVESVVGYFANIPSNIVKSLSNLWEFVRSPFDRVVENVKSLFDFELPMPRIKLPHFSVDWHEIGMGVSLPSIGVSWYKKGAIFTKATMFATPYGMKGVGEAGAEAVLPIEKLDGIVANAIVKANDSLNSGVSISGNTFVVRKESDIEDIARDLYRLIENKKRGVGLG